MITFLKVIATLFLLLQVTPLSALGMTGRSWAYFWCGTALSIALIWYRRG